MTEIGNEYVCACCGETFTKTWTDDEAMEEFKKNFPEHVDDKLAIICDDCYKAMREWYLDRVK